MAEVIRYIDPDASGADDGTSWTDAYETLVQWEAAEQTDLPTDGDWHHVYCRASSGTANTSSTTINGWTTDATHYILIEAASTDRAAIDGWDTAKFRVDIASGDGFFNLESYVRFDGLQVEAEDQSFNLSYATGENRVSNCRIQNGNYGIYLAQPSDSPTIKAWNNIIQNMDNDCVYWRTSAGLGEFYNMIVEGATSRGFILVSGSLSAKNCAVFNNADDFIGGTIDHCASDDGDGTNSVAPSGSDWANEYNNVATGDFTLVTAGNCEGGGTDDPGSGLYSTDMDGDAYSSPWSIGVDAKTGAPPVGGIARSKIGMTLAGDGMTGRF